MKKKIQNNIPVIDAKFYLYIAWVLAVASLVGSLYYSEIKNYTPCSLCWYQRILMYPLVLIIAVGILKKDKWLPLYVLPMSILGMLVAFYQVLLQTGILSEAVAPCAIGVSCITKYTSYFGFVTIPLMSFAAFTIITVCMLIFRKIQK